MADNRLVAALTARHEEGELDREGLPFGARLAAVPNDFTIMRFPDRTRDFVYIEHSAGGLYLDDVKDFNIFVDSWDRLRGAALERQETRQFLKELAEGYRAQMQQLQ